MTNHLPRCKPNTLCEIVRTGPGCQHLLYRRVLITRPSLRYPYGAAWLYESVDGRPITNQNGNTLDFLEDQCLRPVPGLEPEPAAENQSEVGGPR